MVRVNFDFVLKQNVQLIIHSKMVVNQTVNVFWNKNDLVVIKVIPH